MAPAALERGAPVARRTSVSKGRKRRLGNPRAPQASDIEPPERTTGEFRGKHEVYGKRESA